MRLLLRTSRTCLELTTRALNMVNNGTIVNAFSLAVFTSRPCRRACEHRGGEPHEFYLYSGQCCIQKRHGKLAELFRKVPSMAACWLILIRGTFFWYSEQDYNYLTRLQGGAFNVPKARTVGRCPKMGNCWRFNSLILPISSFSPEEDMRIRLK